MNQATANELMCYYIAKWGFSRKIPLTIEQQAKVYREDDTSSFRQLIEGVRTLGWDDRHKQIHEAYKNKTITQFRAILKENRVNINF